MAFVAKFLVLVQKKVSHGARSLIRKLLDKNPVNRISAVDALNDPWVVLNGASILMAPETTHQLQRLRNFTPKFKMQHVVLTYIV